MRVVLSTPGKFHTFDLARQMHARGWLERIITGYPRFKLATEGIPAHLIASFPLPQIIEHRLLRYCPGGSRVQIEIIYWMQRCFESFTAERLPDCDLYMGLSSTTLKAGRLAKRRSGVYVCDRGSSHIRYQLNLLTEEHMRHGFKFCRISQHNLESEEQEYAEADIITVPSTFALRSFLEMGIPESKMRRIGYGVDLSRFHPVSSPDPSRFDVIFVGNASFQKGVPYLLEAFSRIRHPGKHLTFVGTIQPELQGMIAQHAVKEPITYLGRMPQLQLKEVMSRSHVLALPSIQEGMAMVQAQAMACGCPVIGTTNSGAEDLFDDGCEGFVIPIRSPEALADRLQQLAENPDLRQRMSTAGLQKVKALGGWDQYGAEIAVLFQSLIGRQAA